MRILEREFNFNLFISILCLLGYGCLIIFSATSTFASSLAWKQVLFSAVTIGLILYIFLLDIKTIYNWTWFIYIFSLILLIAVFFIGKTSHGAQRWIPLGFFAIQPSEFAKLAIILALAKYMSSNMENNRNLHFTVTSLFIVFLPLTLIIRQPDLGTAITLIPILTAMLFMAGIHLRYFVMLVPFALIPMIIIILAKTNLITIEDLRELLFFLKPYQQNRLLVFIDPSLDPRGLSYNLIQSKIAIGSGGLYGKGFLLGTQTQLQFIPERHTDFIFSVLGEEFGFAGSVLLLFFYYSLLRNGLQTASKCYDFFPKLASIGIVILLLFHVITNVGMTIGLMPITGLPLPFLSYGGSSLLMWMMAMGLLLNFHANQEHKIIRRR